MDNANTVNESGQNLGQNPGGEVVTPSTQTGGEKMFSQADVDNIIKNRLSKFHDYEELRTYKESSEASKLSEMEKLQKQIEKLSPFQEQAKKQSAVLDALLESEMEAIPENMRGLIPESFGTLEKIDYIRKNAEVFKTPAAKPNLPNEADPQQSNTPGLYGGKYNTLEEFAMKDPRGYEAWRKSGGGDELFKM